MCHHRDEPNLFRLSYRQRGAVTGNLCLLEDEEPLVQSLFTPDIYGMSYEAHVSLFCSPALHARGLCSQSSRFYRCGVPHLVWTGYHCCYTTRIHEWPLRIRRRGWHATVALPVADNVCVSPIAILTSARRLVCLRLDLVRKKSFACCRQHNGLNKVANVDCV
jgi:hypothetical protein